MNLETLDSQNKQVCVIRRQIMNNFDDKDNLPLPYLFSQKNGTY